MSLSSPEPILKRPWIPLLLTAVFLLAGVVILILIGPLFTCTKMGCQNSLELTFSHQITQEFTVRVTTTAGDMKQVTCSPESPGPVMSDTDSLVAVCRSSSVTFVNFAPHEVTVEISWQNGGTSTTGKPSYKPFRPNGRFCPPTCQVGSLYVQIP